MSSAQWDVERMRVQAAMQEAISIGREILTPSGAAYLFGKSLETIRRARRAQPDEAVALVLTFEDRPLHMLRLQWAVQKWGKDLDHDRLIEMRERCNTLAVGWAIYGILHDRPIQQGASAVGVVGDDVKGSTWPIAMMLIKSAADAASSVADAAASAGDAKAGITNV